MKAPQPPSGLTPAAKKLWRAIFAENDLDSAAVLLLNVLCEQFDRMHEARALVAKAGITITDRFGQPKPHPACAIERDSSTGMMRAWRLLGFDQAPPIGSSQATH